MALKIEEQAPLRSYTTLKTGGVARYLVTVADRSDIAEAFAFVASHNLPYCIIGGGSNLLAPDEGFPGVIIKVALTGQRYDVDEDGSVLLSAAAGEEFDAVVALSVRSGYWGLENLSAIPGTIGATPVQNVGAYGVEVKDLIESVEVYHIPSGTFRSFTNAECRFGYRDSFFKREEGREYLITEVRMRLSTVPIRRLQYRDLAARFANSEPTLSEIRTAVTEIRAAKFPDWRVLGTAGSFFKNPIVSHAVASELQRSYPELPVFPVDAETTKVSLGYVLDKVCGLKGYRRGAVGLFEAQALVLVNYGGATTADITAFVAEVSEIVRAKTSIVIEPEVRSIE